MSTSAAYVGYMYNTVYSYNTKSVPSTMMYTQTPMNNGLSYYYGTDVTYNSSTDQYTLTDAVQNTWSNQYSSARGLYTCRSTTSSTCSTVYYIVLGVSSNMFGIVMSGGHLLDYYNTNIILGRGYTESNGQYTLTNTASIKKLDWYNNYATYNHYYICNNFDTTCNSITYITSPYSYYYFGLTSNYNNYIYGSNFTYNETTNKYTLGSDRIQFWEMNNTDKQNLNTHHYTCFNDTGECSTLSYINYAETPSNAAYIYYINLTDGKSINDALNEMLLNDNVNQVNSIIKKGIDEWYKKYMISYTSKLEDTIFCNDRSIYDLGEWNPNGGGVTPSLLFKNYNSNTGLNCGNMTDKFSTLNSKAQLLYPVGLLTSPEIRLLNNPNISKNATMYWLNSPYAVGYNSVIEQFVDNYGEVSTEYVENKYGVRPVISLKPGTEYASGTGSMADPYIVGVPMATLTITYTNGNGGATLHEPYVETMPVGKSYSITSPTIPGYTTTMPVVTGTMTNEGRIASVIYLEDSSNPPIIG